jgi:hypothetical protein
MPVPRDSVSLASGALHVRVQADRPGYYAGSTVRVQVTVVAGPEAVVVDQARQGTPAGARMAHAV